MGEKLCDISQLAVMHWLQQSRWYCHRRFCCMHRSNDTHNALKWAGQCQNLPLPLGGSGPTSNTWFLRPTWVTLPNGLSVNLAVFARLMNMTNKKTQTDHI